MANRCRALSIDGRTFDASLDGQRLGSQLERIRQLMLDGQWRTYREIADLVGAASEAGVSARLRDYRKPEHGSYVVEKRRRGDPKRGLWEFRVLPPRPSAQQELPLEGLAS